MSAVIGPEGMVIATAFFVQRPPEGSKAPGAKSVFSTAGAVFSRFEQLDVAMEWATREAAKGPKELLKLELTPNSR